MCGACLKDQVDVTEHIPKKGLVIIQVSQLTHGSRPSPSVVVVVVAVVCGGGGGGGGGLFLCSMLDLGCC